MERWFPPAASRGIGRQRATPAAAPEQGTKHKVISKHNLHIHPCSTHPEAPAFSSQLQNHQTNFKYEMTWLACAITAE